MAIIDLPRRWIRSASWQQPPVYALQRSAWTGRTRVVEIGAAARWTCMADIRPSLATDAVAWQAVQARLMRPVNLLRLPCVEQSQHGAADNFILNPILETGVPPWVVTAGSFQRENVTDMSQTLASADWAFYTDSAQSGARADANGFARFPATTGQRIYISATGFVGVGSTGFLPMAVNFFNVSGAYLSTVSVGGLGPDGGTLGIWRRARGYATAPAGAASVAVHLSSQLTAGYAYVTDVRTSLLPDIALAATGGAGVSLPLTGLQPSAINLRAGQRLTVVLPSGDEQLVALTADLLANSSGQATAALSTPLRETPSAGAAVELSHPWALMRGLQPQAWNVSPGPVYQPGGIQFEEAF